MISKAELEAMGCVLAVGFDRSVTDITGNEIVTNTGTVKRTSDGLYCVDLSSGALSWTTTDTLSTKLSWVNTGSGWTFDETFTEAGTTGVSGFTGKVAKIMLFTTTLTQNQIDSIYEKTYIR